MRAPLLPATPQSPLCFQSLLTPSSYQAPLQLLQFEAPSKQQRSNSTLPLLLLLFRLLFLLLTVLLSQRAASSRRSSKSATKRAESSQRPQPTASQSQLLLPRELRVLARREEETRWRWRARSGSQMRSRPGVYREVDTRGCCSRGVVPRSMR